MRVTAPQGIRCPMEQDPKKYITDDPVGVTVTASAYYRRMVDDGSLIEIVEQPNKKGSKGADGGEQ